MRAKPYWSSIRNQTTAGQFMTYLTAEEAFTLNVIEHTPEQESRPLLNELGGTARKIGEAIIKAKSKKASKKSTDQQQNAR